LGHKLTGVWASESSETAVKDVKVGKVGRCVLTAPELGKRKARRRGSAMLAGV